MDEPVIERFIVQTCQEDGGEPFDVIMDTHTEVEVGSDLSSIVKVLNQLAREAIF